jgi:hypothetical protein
MARSVSGTVRRGKGNSKLTVKFEGQLTNAQWAEFKERLTSLAERYALTVKSVRAAKKRPNKK